MRASHGVLITSSFKLLIPSFVRLPISKSHCEKWNLFTVSYTNKRQQLLDDVIALDSLRYSEITPETSLEKWRSSTFQTWSLCPVLTNAPQGGVSHGLCLKGGRFPTNFQDNQTLTTSSVIYLSLLHSLILALGVSPCFSPRSLLSSTMLGQHPREPCSRLPTHREEPSALYWSA